MNKKLNDSLIKVFFNASESFDNINVCQIVSKFEKKKKTRDRKDNTKKEKQRVQILQKKIAKKDKYI